MVYCLDLYGICGSCWARCDEDLKTVEGSLGTDFACHGGDRLRYGLQKDKETGVVGHDHGSKASESGHGAVVDICRFLLLEDEIWRSGS